MIELCLAFSIVTVLLSIWLTYDSIHGYKRSIGFWDKTKYIMLFLSSLGFALLKRTDILGDSCEVSPLIADFWNIYNLTVFLTILLFVRSEGMKT